MADPSSVLVLSSTEEQLIPKPEFPDELFKDDFDKVYEPWEDTYLLIEAIEKDLKIIKDMNPLVCVEVGCGSGAVITSVAKSLGPYQRLYIGTDFNGQALLTTKKCGIVNGVAGCVQLVHNDLTTTIEDRLKNRVDLLMFNSPYRKSRPDEVGVSEVKSAWCAGINGRAIIDRFLETVPKLLSPTGVLYLMSIAVNNIHEIENRMKSLGFQMEISLEKQTIYENAPEHIYALKFTRLHQVEN
ncbi:methyltransferase N6AMT1-like [Oppia nitens]|uniref:methyltransferase N6AMT1-like n=1 Tax=Oppia nitens TaxID=1686743 RepID=UPI0023DABDB2|nr:methyltransferase N6AMT1-like [Oppia nitens]